MKIFLELLFPVAWPLVPPSSFIWKDSDREQEKRWRNQKKEVNPAIPSPGRLPARSKAKAEAGTSNEVRSFICYAEEEIYWMEALPGSESDSRTFSYLRAPDKDMGASQRFMQEGVGQNYPQQTVRGKNRVVFCLYPIEFFFLKAQFKGH